MQQSVTTMLKPNPNENPEYNRTPNQTKRLREKLEKDIKAFVKKGGRIKKVPPGVRSDSEIVPVADYED